jgi:putative oxidoreductase
MNTISGYYRRGVELCLTPFAEAIALLFVRVSLAGIFWRSGRTKVIENTWIMLSDNTKTLFQEEYAGVPLPPELAARMALGAEHLFPILLVLGLATRFSALSLLIMTLVIQIFVYPDAWWQVHIIWVALALVLIVRGGGTLSLDHWIALRK